MSHLKMFEQFINESKGKYTIWWKTFNGYTEVYDRVNSEDEANKIVKELKNNDNCEETWYEKTGTTEKIMKELDPYDEEDWG